MLHLIRPCATRDLPLITVPLTASRSRWPSARGREVITFPTVSVEEVVRLVRENPGISRAGVCRQLRGGRARREAAIKAAITAGQVQFGEGYYRVRGGALRSGKGLHPGCGPKFSPDFGASSTEIGSRMDAGQLRENRQRAGVSQASLARRLGVSRVLVVRWEMGHQPIPDWAPAHIGAELAKGPDPKPPSPEERAAEAMPRVLAAIEANPGITRTQLQRQLGHGQGPRLALEAALEAGQAHARSAWLPQGHGMRTGTGYYLGPAPAIIPPPPTAEVRAGRTHARWTQTSFAERIGVTASLLATWEKGERPIPAWAAERLHEVLAEARATAPPDRIGDVLPKVLASVRADPGVTIKALGERLGDPWAVQKAVKRAREAGRVHGRQGLYPGPPPKELGPEELVELRRRAGWSRAELARRIGVNVSIVAGWESGQCPIPESRRLRLSGVLKDADRRARREPEARTKRKMTIVAAVRSQPGISMKALTRANFDRGKQTAELLAELVAEGRIHERSGPVDNVQGVRRAMRGFWPGPSPAATPPLHAVELEEARRRVGWSRTELARRLGVSKTLVGYWESGRQPIPPARADGLRELLGQASPVDEPRPVPVSYRDVEIEAAALAIIRAEPGLPRAHVARRMPGDIQRRWRALERLLDRELVHLRPEKAPDRNGRLRKREGLHLGPAKGKSPGQSVAPLR